MLFSYWLSEAFKPQDFLRVNTYLECSASRILTLGFTGLNQEVDFYYLALTKTTSAEFMPSRLHWGKKEYPIDHTLGARIAPDQIGATMKLQYFLEKGIDLSIFELADLDDKALTLYRSRLVLEGGAKAYSQIFDRDLACNGLAVGLIGDYHRKSLAFDQPIALNQLSFDAPSTVKLPNPWTKELMSAYFSPYQILDYWKELVPDLSQVPPEHLDHIRALIKPEERMIYLTYEIEKNLQLDFKHIPKDPRKPRPAVGIRADKKIGPHGLKNFSVYVDTVAWDGVNNGQGSNPDLDRVQAELPALLVQGMWLRHQGEVCLSPVVYHASGRIGLGEISPRESTHGEPWVYATFDPVMSALFISGIGGDFTCAVLRCSITGIPIVNERFEGAFDLRYKGQKGCIYTLSNTGFQAGCTEWPEEMVAQGVQPVLRAEVIEDAGAYLEALEAQGQLVILRYPQKHPSLPPDDKDLLDKALAWSKSRGPWVLEDLKRYHPNLFPQAEKFLKNEKKKGTRK